MKNTQKLYKPEEYILSEQEFKNINKFDFLLDKLTDVSNSEPLHKIAINNIGISKQKVMVSIEDIGVPGKYISMLCNVSASVDLFENRGIHMSRCIESLFTLAQKKYKTLDDFASELAKIIRERQESKTAFTKVTGTYIHKRYTRKTKLESYDSLELISNAIVSKNKTYIKTGMKVQNATACPCTKTYTKYSIVPELKAMGLNLPQIQQILDITTPATHMQLGPTTLIIDKENSDISHKQLYEVLDNSLHLVYELLKRPDEHDFVKSVIGHPQFTEDATREVVSNAYHAFKEKLSSKSELYVESILQDSIHTHDVQTLIHKTFGDLKSELDQ